MKTPDEPLKIPFLRTFLRLVLRLSLAEHADVPDASGTIWQAPLLVFPAVHTELHPPPLPAVQDLC